MMMVAVAVTPAAMMTVVTMMAVGTAVMAMVATVMSTMMTAAGLDGSGQQGNTSSKGSDRE